MRLSVAVLQLALLLAALPTHVSAAKKKSGSKKSSEEPILELTDATVEDELKKNPLMLISFTVPGCADCELVAKALRQAKAELRVQSADSVTLAQLTITSQESPAVARITQGQLQLPKLLVFRDGEAMDYTGTELTKKDIVSTMLREYSRPSVQALSSVKQTERFLHLDSWAAQHPDEEKPPRVVGFFPSNATAGYAVFRSMARKLQGMISFGEIFDGALQKKFLGSPAKKTVVQVVKADKRERSLTYGGPLAVAPLARWVATHSLAIVQDLTTESSIEAHMARGVPVFLLLMPDEYEDSLNSMMKAFRNVAAKVRERLLFAYGFKDTEPWPQFAQSLQIPRDATGAFWMIVGNGMEITGRNWSTAWLKPPSLGFQIYAMKARGDEQAEDVTEAKVQEFVDQFLNQVDAVMPPEVIEGVVEEETEASGDAGGSSEDGSGGSSGGGSAGDAERAERAEKMVNYDKELRKLIAALEMSFNSGIANVKKTLDDIKDSPQLLPGKSPGLTATVSTMDLKVKKGIMDLKRKLMDVGKAKDEL